jgi:hypothetical protein
MKPSLLARGLLAVGTTLLLVVGLGSLLGCQLTLSDLQARNPNAKTLLVHCRPWQIAGNVKLFLVHLRTDHIVTDETQSELFDYAREANVFIEVNASAPRENAETMASDYGLVCDEYLAVRSTPLESLRPTEPCSMQANAARNPQFVGDANSQPCDSGQGNPANAGAGTAGKDLPSFTVCARPQGITSNTWYGGKGIKPFAKDQADWEAQVAKADRIFVFDASAEPESIWHYGPDTKIRCPGRAPIPYEQWAAKNSGAGSKQSGKANAGTGKSSTSTTSTLPTTPTPTTTATTPKAGSAPPSPTSSATGQGPALSIFEQIANQMIVAGALAQGNTSTPLNQVGGHRNGMPGGTNVGGFSFPLLQAGVGTFQVLGNIGISTSPLKFFKSVSGAAKKGQRSLIEKADKEALEFADKLIEKHGQYEMAKGLEEMQTVMPYAMGEKFTANLGGKFQAHKIFEKRALEKLTGRKDFDKLPSVILTDAEHKKVTDLLNKAWKEYGPQKMGEKVTVEQLRNIYKRAYKDYPHWLEIIESQLR